MTTPVILGIDEVGRGPWAGPLVVGAVILGPDFQALGPEVLAAQDSAASTTTRRRAKILSPYDTLTDSKKLSQAKRHQLAPIILEHAQAAATGWVSSSELDHYGLSASLKLATRRAVKQILAEKVFFSEIIIDGVSNFLTDTPLAGRVTLLKKADLLIKEVSAASIIAKVARDDYMTALAQTYPAYGFEQHVGYGTSAHKSALLEHGICPEHRQSYRPIRQVLRLRGESPAADFDAKPSAVLAPSSTDLGRTAENIVRDHLSLLGHKILAQNTRSKSYEIDLVSLKSDHIYFTEVKYRKTADFGSALDQVTPAKHQQMHFAAENYLATHPKLQSLIPELAVATVEGPDFTFKDWLVLSAN